MWKGVILFHSFTVVHWEKIPFCYPEWLSLGRFPTPRMLLLQPLKCWVYRHTTPCPPISFLKLTKSQLQICRHVKNQANTHTVVYLKRKREELIKDCRRHKPTIKWTSFTTIVIYFKRIVQSCWDSKQKVGRGDQDLEPNMKTQTVYRYDLQWE